MIFAYFVLAVALLIETVGAYYSITGLAAIFSGAVIPILIMGSSLEIGKVTAAVWLKNNWHRASLQYKLYLLPAVALLMVITSMGIFGFLSKAHNDQNLVSGDVQAKIAIYDEKIKTARENIDANRKALQQMDAAVDQTMGRSTTEQGADKAVAIRRSQAKERTRLQSEIEAEQKKISRLNEEAAPIRAEVRKVEAEVGPIKYIAKLIYGDNPDANILEKAVVWVIMMIVAVFDPLALVLILAAQQSIRWAKEDKENPEGWHKEWVPDSEAWPEWEEDPEAKEFFDRGKEIARQLDADAAEQRPAYLATDKSFYSKPEGWVSVPPQVASTETQEEPVKKSKPKKKPKAKPEFVSPNAPGLDASLERPGDYLTPQEIPHADPPPIRGFQAPATDEAPINPIPQAIVIPDFSINADIEPANASFGDTFPSDPKKGDLYLRVDMLPSKLFKWNEKKWIEVDKEKTDYYAYDQEYIKHLINKIDSGEYDIDLVTAAEQEQISRYLQNGNQQ